MELLENLQKVNVLKAELDNFRPLSSEQEKMIMQKFRLDWNYHSSHIEGNSLTYGETKALLLFGHTAQAKPLKDHLEMSGHDEAIKYIEDVIKQKRPLTESFIRDLHELILKQPYQVDAITSDGKPTKKWVSVGKYKTTPNHVLTKTGEIFYFAKPEETPAKMADLLKWYSVQIENKDIDPVIFATEFHYRFIRIHPFDDGNGRIARLLMNFILMQLGFPPAIIKTENKEAYYNALEQADAGQLDYFFNYICEEVINSLDLMLRGARGEEIEEPDDLDKKLKLLKQKIGDDINLNKRVLKSPYIVSEILDFSIYPLFQSIEKMLSKMDGFFKSRSLKIEYGNYKQEGIDLAINFKKLLETKINKELSSAGNIYSISVTSSFNGLRHNSKNVSIKGVDIRITFHDFVYEISGSGLDKSLNKSNDQKLSEEEIKYIVNKLGNWQYNILEESVNKV
ncbi:MAG: Fic family protein [Prolixibacteraceae bacterium]|nr:Fic family protein [Prolixibacteraceae bacterium]MBN2774049.1 Fic family protein [Prolixibacteraceae bacterium]